ncbi:MAG TPA: hypothetical protein VHY48_02015 [Acidobacteriaceae bacterium]|jgi:hypothetical protein|nr:hypothetical protein [Acidobacteriaceae bacterium]
MNFLKIFFRGISLLPGVVQSVEALFGTKSGAQKKEAALHLVSATINITDALEKKTIIDAPSFSSGLGTIIDGVVACLNASIWHKS